ncbi:unnamed protein product, partial [Linum tenue]
SNLHFCRFAFFSRSLSGRTKKNYKNRKKHNSNLPLPHSLLRLLLSPSNPIIHPFVRSLTPSDLPYSSLFLHGNDNNERRKTDGYGSPAKGKRANDSDDDGNHGGEGRRRNKESPALWLRRR